MGGGGGAVTVRVRKGQLVDHAPTLPYTKHCPPPTIFEACHNKAVLLPLGIVLEVVQTITWKCGGVGLLSNPYYTIYRIIGIAVILNTKICFVV
jgi:hypothetical protein